MQVPFQCPLLRSWSRQSDLAQCPGKSRMLTLASLVSGTLARRKSCKRDSLSSSTEEPISHDVAGFHGGAVVNKGMQIGETVGDSR